MRRLILCLILMFSFFPNACFAQELVDAQREALELETIEGTLEDGTSFSDVVEDVFSGKETLKFEDLPEKLAEMAFGELRTQRMLIMQLTMVVILSAILRQVSGSFYGKSVGEMGFYICYMVLVVIIITSFYSISESVVERVSQACTTFAAMIPIFVVLLASGGNISQASLIGPTVLGGSTILSLAIRNFIIPAILLAIALEMADHISEKPILSRFASLLRNGIAWLLKGSAMIYMFLLSLQKIGGGVVNGLVSRTAKIAVHSIPVVGDVMGGAVETMGAVASTLKSGTLVATAIFLLLLCLPLLIKLVVILVVFKLTAAAAEFICEERLVDCINAAGDYTALLIGVVFLVETMFLFSAFLLLGSL